MYTCHFDEKQIDLDNYERGEIPGESACFFVDYDFKSDSLPDLFAKIADFFEVETECIEAINGDNTICVSRSENVDAEKATDYEFLKFKEGKCKLWNASYWGYVQRCENVPENEMQAALNV